MTAEPINWTGGGIVLLFVFAVFVALWMSDQIPVWIRALTGRARSRPEVRATRPASRASGRALRGSE